MLLNSDRLFPADTTTRTIAKRLFAEVESLPLICPHGHTDPAWFAANEHFTDPAQTLIVPDHYIFRMLVSQGVPLEKLGIPYADGKPSNSDSRKIWHEFARHYYLFRCTPTRLWLDHTFQTLFGITDPLTTKNADHYYDTITDCLQKETFRPRALFERFNIEVLATTEAPGDSLSHHQVIRASTWKGRVITAYRPDPFVDPDYQGFLDNIALLGELTGEPIDSWAGYLQAHRQRREFFASMGATSTDHGHPTAATADLSEQKASALYAKVIQNTTTAEERALFRAQMLTEMAAMSIDDGLVMQIHPGSVRNHHHGIYAKFGRDKGFDIPRTTNYVDDLSPLLNRFGTDSRFSLIVFTLDESAYSRELAPLAGVYPCLKLGPAWWFHDSPEGMLRYRQHTTETAGFYNTVGFNDDTRAFPSIPARHDVARRIDCAYLAQQVVKHTLSEDDARDVAVDLAYRIPKAAYKL